MAYYNLDQILMEEELIPCVASIDIVNLGFLDKEETGEHLRQGCKLELPLWMVKAMKKGSAADPRAIITIDKPKPFSPSNLEMLRHDAHVVKLHELSSYYFDFAMAYAGVAEDQFPDLELINDAFAQRYQIVSDLSQNTIKGDTTDRIRRLDNLERSLYKLGAASDDQYQRWAKRQAHVIKTVPGADRPAAKRSKSVLTEANT